MWIEDIIISLFMGVVYGGVFLLLVTPSVGLLVGLIVMASVYLWLNFA